ncbi:MAG: DNA polymerase III subunit alpha [Lentimicrobiaceae bacterium]|nr:DNA polymerase III subunit alpha [Lentimicrobiaceae bacterium]MCB9024311.1 DNA polymerase III subunit alpha [Lentimicrobiaceae bacterium]MCO5264724.1 DNA polymerase III subunit alpha [Lentimicrobium sp.]HPG33112.1 DNA polymerase III subunit alpha [Lentimicrobium sp.]
MHLTFLSYYSLRYGTLPIDQIPQSAAAAGADAVLLTDINNTSGTIDFVKACHKAGIKPMAGVEFREGNRLLYTGIAENNKGFKELNDLLSRCNIQGTPLPWPAPPMNHVFILYPFGSRPINDMAENEFTGVTTTDISKLPLSDYSKHAQKYIIHSPIVFADEKGYELHRYLRAIDNNILLSRLTPAMVAGSERFLTDAAGLKQLFENYPELIRNTERLAGRCSIDFDFRIIKNKRTFTGSAYDDRLLLEKLSLEGMEYRYGKNNREAAARVRHELDIIDRLKFGAYFLITWDIIRYSMSRGFYHVGRGSGANSIVAYCLRITDVDPIELNLYFERFLNPKRSSPPDFDIDYSWKERDEVLDYIFKRYGREHTALLGATSTFKGKSILRELGKVMGLPKAELDRLVDEPGNPLNQDDITRHITEIGIRMTDFPNIRSIHAGGILISEEPITCYTALDLPPKSMPVTQWDMYVAEDLGFEKLDILSQRGIGHIHDCVEIVKANHGISIDIHQVEKFKQDAKVKEQLREGETNGCFYIESPAMRGLLKKLRCDNYLSLVAASSIIRPGVARSGMMREYIRRFHNPEGFDYIHPIMKEQLSETYGVMVYQEDVLKICHHFAGLDLADADVLRRAMSGKYRSRVEFQKIIDKFFDNCRNKGYAEEITNEVWRQIESFAGYSFSKAHSASFAVESYQSLYLKSYFPIEFMVAVINNFGGFYQSWVYFNEAKRCGAIIELPCINRSYYLNTLSGNTIYMGFIHIAGLESNFVHSLLENRGQNGLFLDLYNFIDRMKPAMEQLIILIRTGALRFTGLGKQQLLWEAHMLTGKKRPEPAVSLFRQPVRQFSLPALVHSPLEDAYDEIELLDFPISMNYFEMLKTNFRGEIQARHLRTSTGQTVKMAGILVTIKYVRTIRNEIMHFATFFDDEGEFFDTVHFPDTVKEFPFRGRGVYLLLGKVVEEFGFPSLEVSKMAKLPPMSDPRYL